MSDNMSNKERLSHLLKVGEMDDATIAYITKAVRLTSLLHLGTITEDALTKATTDGFGPGDISTILSLKAWVEYYKSTHDGNLPTVWTEEFTSEKFLDFVLTRPDKKSSVPTVKSTEGRQY